ncbi:hypothetical protein K493DRAFT_320547 [Basidiobolus meristosporus CBS 931.73]|uniref:Polysaccharide lyase 14 domain-containing protein n=1 Tax=Basidiobolus meristosporus CBS 931.73 TaxID=1314790 RepID=A0A1Y1X884_9FUNG|nr:hypothetical protein K493DRAFT_320547 [Basidiobolus meristosporus CBS 931.73]|eukprot:ORX81950.1 hypothetical protein K493DRAFT_320547 [Basidiobolus meristosporus CBS 931.73]
MVLRTVCIGLALLLQALYSVECLSPWQEEMPSQHHRSWSNYGATNLTSFNISKVTFGRHNYRFVNDPDGNDGEVLRVFYPKGSRTPTSPGKQGGFGFYAEPLALNQEATLQYKVYFPKDFDFVKGGKLPGFYGGGSECPNGKNNRQCMTTRYMWRTHGYGEVYAYLPYDQNPEYCHIPPHSICNHRYGDSLGRGSFQFARGKWNTIRQSLRMNDVGKQNGLIQVWFNGKLVINYDKAVLRRSDDERIIGLVFHTFFGGSTPAYRTPKSQYSYFKDFEIYNYIP